MLLAAESLPLIDVVPYQRLLILTGPTGAAKTETIRQLSSAAELDFELVEWKNDTMARSGESLSDDQGQSAMSSR